MLSKIAALTFVFLALMMPVTTYAQEYTLLEPLPCVGEGCTAGKLIDKVDISQYFQYVFRLFIGIAGAAAVFMIIYHGFMYMTVESWTGKGAHIKAAQDSVIGLLMVLSTFLILQTINPKLVDLKTTLVPKITTSLSKDKVGDFINKLENDKDYASFFLQNAENVKAVNDLKLKSSEIQSRKDEIWKKMGDASLLGDQEEYDRLEVELAKITEEETIVADELAVGIAKRTFISYANSIIPSKGAYTKVKEIGGTYDAAIDQLIYADREYINKYYDATIKKMREAGISPEAEKEITSYRFYADTKIRMNYEVAKVLDINIMRNEDKSEIGKIFSDYVLGTKEQDAKRLAEVKTKSLAKLDTISEYAKKYVLPEHYTELEKEIADARTRIQTEEIR